MSRPSLAALLAGERNAYLRVDSAPDGRHAMLIAANEVRMSHWIESAALYTMPDETLVAALGGSGWSTDRIAWSPDGGTVTLDLRRYPGDAPGVTVEIDLKRHTARIADGADLPVAGLSAALEEDYRQRGGRG
jgi:hypothetical protein